MTATRRPERPAEHALLGLLALEPSHAAHGYDLARHFADGQPLGEVFRLESGMLYHHLKKLAAAGWVVSSTEAQSSRPARRVFRLSTNGRAELDRWLQEPVSHTREIRLEFLVKLYFAQLLAPDRVANLIAEQTEVLRRLAANLETQLAAATDPFHLRVLALRRDQTDAALQWLSDLS